MCLNLIYMLLLFSTCVDHLICLQIIFFIILMKHAIPKFIKLWKLEIRKSHCIINLSSPSSRALASETTPWRRVFQFKKGHLWHNGHSWRSELKIRGANYLWEFKFHFFPWTRLWEGRNNNSNINFNTNLAQRSVFLQLYTYDIPSKLRFTQ